MTSISAAKAAEKLLGTSLPDSATDVHYHRWQPDTSILYFEAYIRFDVTETDFEAFMKRLGMAFYRKDPAAFAHLPANWRTVDEVELAWWTASPATPEASTARDFGMSGWIIAKYEDGHVFMHVTDMGSADSSTKIN